MAINAQELQGQWNQLKGKVKEKWGQLTDDDLTVQGGNFDQVIGKIQHKTGEGREAIERFISSLTSGGSSAISNAAEKARDFAVQSGDRFREGYDQASDFARQRMERAEDLVRERPVQSVAAVFGVGLVLGVLVGISLRSR